MKKGNVLIAQATVDASSTNITASAYLALTLKDVTGTSITSNLLPFTCSRVQITSGATNPVEIALGESGSERSMVVLNAYSGAVPCFAPGGCKVSVKSCSGTISSGIFNISFYA
jgi:hypothetical protein